jgi:VanZ family protein
MRHRAVWLALGCLGIALVAYLTLKSGRHHFSDSAAEDKIEHVAAFLVPTLWFGLLYDSARWSRGVTLCVLTLAVLLEVAQREVGHNPDYDWGDIVANCAGALLGWWLLKSDRLRVRSRVEGWLERR